MAKKANHITDKAADVLDDAIAPLTKRGSGLLGISPNPATNMFIADIAMRGISRLGRNSLHKAVLQNKYGRGKAKDIVENKSLLRTAALFGASRIATRSVPGAVLVSGGLIAKALLERRQAKKKGHRAVRREGERTLRNMAEE